MRSKAGPPVRLEDFFERPVDVRRLWDCATRGHVAMLAPRRIGKTSLLFHLVDAPADGWTCLYLTVESLESEAQFVARLFETVSEAHPDGAWSEHLRDGMKRFFRGMGKARLGPVDIEFAEALKADWREAGAAALRVMREIRGNTLILVDEFPIFVRTLLGKTPDESRTRRTQLFLQWFREIRNAPHEGKARIHFLLTGSIGLDGVVQSVGLTGTINDLHSFTLGPLTSDLSRIFLRRLSEGEELPLSTPVVERILDRVDWKVPYHLQLLFQEILHQARERGQTPTPELVDEACDALLTSRNQIYFRHWVERLADAFPKQTEHNLCKAVLAAAAKDQKGATQGTILQLRRKIAPDVDLNAVLSSLEHDGYLIPHDGRWRFTSSLLREWRHKWQKRR